MKSEKQFYTGISENWGPLVTIGGTRDPRPDTHLMGETRDPRTGTLKVGPQTRDPGRLFYMGANARDPGHLKRDLGH